MIAGPRIVRTTRPAGKDRELEETVSVPGERGGLSRSAATYSRFQAIQDSSAAQTPRASYPTFHLPAPLFFASCRDWADPFRRAIFTLAFASLASLFALGFKGSIYAQVTRDIDLAPANLNAARTDDAIALNWDEPVSDSASVTGYEIVRHRRFQNQTTSLSIVEDTSSIETTYEDSTANDVGFYYVYQVRASRNGVKSLWSNEARIDPAAQDFGTVTPDTHLANPRGIWSDGTTMWVADNNTDRIYAYNLTTKARVPSTDFGQLRDTGVYHPRGIWSDGTTMWVADNNTDTLVAYDLSHKGRDEDQDINILSAAANNNAYSMWSDGTTLWVSDVSASKIFAYDLGTRTRDREKEFDTLDPAGNESPRGIWSDGTTMWVADRQDDEIYAYRMSDRSRNESYDINTLTEAGNTSPAGIWSNGATMWVADVGDGKIYAHRMPDVQQEDDGIRPLPPPPPVDPPETLPSLPWQDFNTLAEAGNLHPRGIWSDGTKMYVADPGTDKIYVYDLSSKERIEEEDFDTRQNRNPYGIWSDGYGGLWVVDNTDETILGYDLATKGRDPLLDLSYSLLAGAGNRDPQGLWSVGQTMWVTDNDDDKIYAYAGGHTYDSTQDFNSLEGAGNEFMGGIWSDESTMWVADAGSNRLYTYHFDTKEADSVFGLATENDTPTGLWSNGSIMWVADAADGKIYAYSMEQVADATLSALSLSGLSLAFAFDTMDYEVDAPYKVTATTITAIATNTMADVSFALGSVTTDADPATESYQVNLAVGATPIEVTVVAADGMTTQTYTVTVNREAESDEGALPNLWLSPPATDPVASIRSAATYTVTFQGAWTTTVTSGGVPSGAHFTTLIGGVHNAGVTFLSEGGMASAGVEFMAELGGTSTLANEVRAAQPDALSVLQGSSGNIGPTGSSTISTITLTTGPSPGNPALDGRAEPGLVRRRLRAAPARCAGRLAGVARGGACIPGTPGPKREPSSRCRTRPPRRRESSRASGGWASSRTSRSRP